MTQDQIISEVNAIFCDVLDDENIRIQLTTTAKEVDGWDSLTHIQLVVAIEKHFKIRFTAAEIREFRDVGEMCQCIQTRTQKA